MTPLTEQVKMADATSFGAAQRRGDVRSGDNGRWVAVVQRVDHFPRRYAVDGRVVQFEQHAERSGGDAFDVVDAFDDPQLPQRAVRSIGRECSRLVSIINWRQSRGCVTAMWRTWNSRSKSGSSTQYGVARSNGARASLLRKPADKYVAAHVSEHVLESKGPPGSADWS